MYEAREHWIAYKKEKQRKHKHEVIASISAITFFVVLTLLITFVI